MYKVCFVDDEPIVLRVMQTLVDWQAMGFSVVGIATDGLEALELCEKEHPDLMFLDIKMPLMDGITCAQRIRSQDKRIKLILLTAFNSFSFAQTAIELGVNGYLLKPVNREAVNALVAKLVAELDAEQEKATKQEYEALRRELQNELFRLHDCEENHWNTSWLRDSRLLAEQHGLIDLYTNAEGDATAANFITFLEGLDVTVWTDFKAKPGRYYLLTSVLPLKIRKAVQSFLTYIPKEQHCAAYFLPDLSHCGLETLMQVLAANAANDFYHYDNSIYSFMETPPSSKRPISRRETEKALNKAIADYSFEGICTFIESVYDIAEKQLCSPHQLKTFSYDLFVQMKMALLQFSSPSHQAEEWEPGIEFFLSANNIRTLRERTGKAIARFFELPHIPKIHTTILQANAFAAQNFSDPALTLESAAQHVRLSKNYFIKLYKQEMGNSFWEYITTLRINRAKELLRQTNLPITEICECIGYDSVYYFSKKFKLVVGVSPREYRVREI